MTKKTQCGSCAALFDEDEVVTKFRRGSRETPDEYSDHCPECDSDDLDVVYLCAECGDVPAVKGSDNCKGCDDKLAAEEG